MAPFISQSHHPAFLFCLQGRGSPDNKSGAFSEASSPSLAMPQTQIICWIVRFLLRNFFLAVQWHIKFVCLFFHQVT